MKLSNYRGNVKHFYTDLDPVYDNEGIALFLYFKDSPREYLRVVGECESNDNFHRLTLFLRSQVRGGNASANIRVDGGVEVILALSVTMDELESELIKIDTGKLGDDYITV